MSYKNFPLAIFWYFVAVAALYQRAKIRSLLFSNKLSREVGVLGLSRFFVFLSSQKFAPLYLKNYTSYADHFSYSPITLPQYQNLEKYPIWGSRFGGYSGPKTIPEAKISKFSLFLRGHCAKTLRISGSEPVSFCTTWGPLVSAATHLRANP